MNCCATCEYKGGCSLCEDCDGQHYAPAQIEMEVKE
jgi:hypothetical protein